MQQTASSLNANSISHAIGTLVTLFLSEDHEAVEHTLKTEQDAVEKKKAQKNDVRHFIPTSESASKNYLQKCYDLAIENKYLLDLKRKYSGE
jgi:hypothetical protein